MSIISRTQIYDTETGIRILNGHVKLSNVMVDNATHSCLEIAGSSTTTFDLDGSHLRNCGVVGMLINTGGLVDINNVTVDSGSIGVKVSAVEGRFKMRNSGIFDMTSSAIDAVYSHYFNETNYFNIENSVIHNC